MSEQTLILDIECYRNYFLVKFKHIGNQTYRDYEMYPDSAIGDVELNAAEIKAILIKFQIVTFNGLNYDMPMLTYALVLCSRIKREMITVTDACRMLKEASDAIIVGNLRNWQFEDQFDIKVPVEIDHIDLAEVAPGVMISLKQYGGRMHSRKLQDLPIPPEATITPPQRAELRAYCANDLDTTEDLWLRLSQGKDDVITIRAQLGKERGMELRSKSDAQVAEAVIKYEVERITNRRIYKPDVPAGTRYKYVAPAFIKFRTEQMQAMLASILDADFIVQADGKIAEPAALANGEIRMGGSRYTMGIGGLHSCEKSICHVVDSDTMLVDRDVVSFYPELIVQCGLAPKNMGENFSRIYRQFLHDRKWAKKHGQTTKAQTLKIALNGTFGKLGSRYSVLYAPDLLIQVTVTGQLVLLMMIEALEMACIPVVSANTDGIVIKCPKVKREQMLQIVAAWEKATNLETEETPYKALYSRDINNYFALKLEGGYKAKGTFTAAGLMKNPQNEICNIAVAALLENGTPIAETILRCTDIRKFLSIQKVTGGGIKILQTRYDDSLTPAKQRDVLLANDWTQDIPGPLTKATFSHWSHPEGSLDVKSAYRVHSGEDTYRYLGKVVRWYYAVGERGAIHYLKKNASGNHNKVASTDGAKPVMELPDDFPSDIDYEWYIREANSILRDLGAVR